MLSPSSPHKKGNTPQHAADRTSLLRLSANVSHVAVMTSRANADQANPNWKMRAAETISRLGLVPTQTPKLLLHVCLWMQCAGMSPKNALLEAKMSSIIRAPHPTD